MSRLQGDVVTVTTEAGPMPARLWLPPAGRGPALLLQEIFGVSGYIQRRGADLAAAGYVVLAPELYWRLDATAIDESAPRRATGTGTTRHRSQGAWPGKGRIRARGCRPRRRRPPRES